MTKDSLLWDGFASVSAADWRESAEKNGGCDVSTLHYRTEDGAAIPVLSVGLHVDPVPGRAPGTPWLVFQRIDDGAVRERASAALGAGAEGVELVFRGSAVSRGAGLPWAGDRLPELADMHDHPVRIDAGEQSYAIVERVAQSPGWQNLSVAFDPIAALAAGGRMRRSLDTCLDDAGKTGRAFMRGQMRGDVIVADGRPWNDAGASDVQELAIVLATFVAFLRAFCDRGWDLHDAAGRIGVALAATADQFASIAKFRAARQLIARALELAGIPSGRPRVHGETAWRMLAPRTPEVNMLRATVATLAMAAGGADSIAALPALWGRADFDDRMARNTQLILNLESRLARVSDPGAGAGAVEALTAALAEAAWNRFREIETRGGIVNAVLAGSIQTEVAATRQDRRARIARRDIELVGVNVHVDPHAASEASSSGSSTDRSNDDAYPVQRLTSLRLSEDFDRLRDRADQISVKKRRPSVFLVVTGPDDGARRAALAAADALAAGGIATDHRAITPTDGQLARAFTAARTPVACICCGEVSPAGIAALAARLTSAGARQVLVCGAAMAGMPADKVPELFLQPGGDLVERLSAVLDTIAGFPDNMRD